MLGGLTLLGLLLASGVVGGWLARMLRLPTLTGYLAAGIVIHLFEGPLRIDHGQLSTFNTPINALAMALALFVLGGQFTTGPNSRGLGRLARVSFLDAGITAGLVGLTCGLALGSFAGGLILGILGIAVAPATTLEVLHEFQAKGPVTRALKRLTALSNIWAIFFFELALLALMAIDGGEASVLAPVWDLAGSLLIGLIAGHFLIFLQEQVGRENDAVPLLAIIFLTIGVCNYTEVPHMLAFLVTGAVVANRSRFFPRVTAGMDVYAQPAFVLFFVLSGSHLNFDKLGDNILVVVCYVLARSAGKVLSMRLGLGGDADGDGSRKTGERVPMGLGLLCQAGAAIALANYVGRYSPELAETILSVILGSVVIFELIGPILVKRVAVAAGEVSLGNLLTHNPDSGSADSLLASIGRTLRGSGHEKAQEAAPAGTVGRFMRPNMAALPREATMDDILRFANSSPFSMYPVVDPERRLVGLISLAELSKVAYDRTTASLVTAEDLATLGAEECALAVGEDLDHAKTFFQEFPGDIAAAVDQEGKLVGLVERTEVLSLLRKRER